MAVVEISEHEVAKVFISVEKIKSVFLSMLRNIKKDIDKGLIGCDGRIISKGNGSFYLKKVCFNSIFTNTNRMDSKDADSRVTTDKYIKTVFLRLFAVTFCVFIEYASADENAYIA